jgi:hypothetical protein
MKNSKVDTGRISGIDIEKNRENVNNAMAIAVLNPMS